MDQAVRPSLQEGGEFPISVGQSHTMYFGPISAEEVRRFMGDIPNQNLHHTAHQGALEWCKWLRADEPKDGGTIVPGIQIMLRCESELVGWLGQGTTIRSIDYNFDKPLRTGERARLVMTLMSIRVRPRSFIVTLDAQIMEGAGNTVLGHGKGITVVVPRFPLFDQSS